MFSSGTSVMKVPRVFLAFHGVCTVNWQYLKIFEKRNLTLIRTKDNC